MPKLIGVLILLSTLSLRVNAVVEIHCDRACLKDFLEIYLEAVVSHDPEMLPVTKNVKYTENGVRITLGDGLWQTASAEPTYKVEVFDEEAGQVGLLAKINENGNNNWYAVRLKVEQGKSISEIETLIARNLSGGGGGPQFSPPHHEPHPLMMQELTNDDQLSRSELVSIGNSYFTGLDTDNHGSNVPFSPDCQRRENGTTTSNDPLMEKGSMVWMDCKSQFDTGFSVIVTDIRERRFEVVDPLTGLAFGWGYFDHSGGPETFDPSKDSESTVTTFRQPFSFYIAEIFKVIDGEIRQIEAVLTTVPYNMESGW
jgi:hypothetical protein